MKKILMSLGTIAAVVAPVTAVVACGTKQIPDNREGDIEITHMAVAPGTADTPITLAEQESVTGRAEHVYTTKSSKGDLDGEDVLLSSDSYKDFKSEVDANDGTIGIVIVANGKVDTDIVKIKTGETSIEALDSSKFIFKRFMHPQFGAFLNSYSLRIQPNIFIHGTNTNKNYNDYYPMFYVNEGFAHVGATSYLPAAEDVIEFSFDKV